MPESIVAVGHAEYDQATRDLLSYLEPAIQKYLTDRGVEQKDAQDFLEKAIKTIASYPRGEWAKHRMPVPKGIVPLQAIPIDHLLDALLPHKE